MAAPRAESHAARALWSPNLRIHILFFPTNISSARLLNLQGPLHTFCNRPRIALLVLADVPTVLAMADPQAGGFQVWPPSFPWPANAAVAVVAPLLLTYLITLWNSFPSNHKGSGLRKPRSVPYLLPYIGHSLTYKARGRDFLLENVSVRLRQLNASALTESAPSLAAQLCTKSRSLDWTSGLRVRRIMLDEFSGRRG